MIKYILMTGLLFAFVYSQAQSVSVSGHVLDENKEDAVGVSVILLQPKGGCKIKCVN